MLIVIVMRSSISVRFATMGSEWPGTLSIAPSILALAACWSWGRHQPVGWVTVGDLVKFWMQTTIEVSMDCQKYLMQNLYDGTESQQSNIKSRWSQIQMGGHHQSDSSIDDSSFLKVIGPWSYICSINCIWFLGFHGSHLPKRCPSIHWTTLLYSPSGGEQHLLQHLRLCFLVIFVVF